jgi:methylmalonyl-CoA mutase C-terminal domain/subunit
VVVFGGGIVPAEDIGPLEQAGVAKVFTPGARIDEIVGWVQHNVGVEHGQAS